MMSLRFRHGAGTPPLVFAISVLARAALGLFVHGLRRPGAPAAIDRFTGKVAPR